jgi:hypothetical protein
MTQVCVFSEVKGQILLHGVPASNAKIKRRYEFANELKEDDALTDLQGYFYLPAIYQSSWVGLLPMEFVVAQSMVVSYQEKDYKIWSNTKRSTTENSELGGHKLILTCELNEPLTLYRDFGSILRTNCKWSN